MYVRCAAKRMRIKIKLFLILNLLPSAEFLCLMRTKQITFNTFERRMKRKKTILTQARTPSSRRMFISLKSQNHYYYFLKKKSKKYDFFSCCKLLGILMFYKKHRNVCLSVYTHFNNNKNI